MGPLLKTTLIAMASAPAWTIPAAAADVPEIALAQVTEVDGQPLPRPVVGVAFPGVTSLPFHLALTYRCPAGTQRSQLFVSIADTARLDDAAAAPSPQTVRLDVPVKQLAWLLEPDLACDTVAGHRAADEVGESGIRYFRLHVGTAGFATLLCAGKEGPAAGATTTAPLDVWISCPADSP